MDILLSRRWLGVLVCALTIMASGCVQRQSALPVSRERVESPQERADTLMRASRFAEAAAILAQLGQNVEIADRTDYRARAALLYADLGDMQRALALFPTPQDTPPAAPPRQALVEGLRLVHEGAAERASFVLNGLDSTVLDAYERGLFLRQLGRLQLTERNPAALMNLLNAELFPLPPNRRTELTHLIWDALRANADPGFDTKADVRNPNLPGWVVLLNDFRRLGQDPAALAIRLAEWRTEYPQHPANELLVDAILELAEEQSAPITRIALLLPFDGELSAYARAVRNGFVSMRLMAGDHGVSVRMYPAAGATATAAYQRAIQDGAQLVVGPLDKPGIESLAKLPARPVAILGLNNVDVPPGALGNTGLGITQYGLAPEDEGSDLANRAWRDGRRRMAVIIPNTDLGTRIRTAFAQRWTELGGALVEESRYSGSVDSYKRSIRETFSLAQSEARAMRLRRLLNRPLVFVSKPRPDLDAIMLVADPVSGRQIIPQFRFLGVDRTPIYATSHIFAGNSNAKADQDLDGVAFGTMPWHLGLRDASLRDLSRRHWPRAGATEQSLFAFGVDAYRVAHSLRELASVPGHSIQGATGDLRRDEAGRIRRSLAWAAFRGGVARPLSP